MKTMRTWLAMGAVLAMAAGNAVAGVGINWVTIVGAYDHTATNLTADSHALLDSYGVTWQLIYAGPNGVIDAPDLSNAANGWVGGDDVVWGSRVIAQGGGTASDGTVWDRWLSNQSGNAVYVNEAWNTAGSVYQRVYEGAPAVDSWYYDSGLQALDLGFTTNSPYFPQNFYPDTFTNGFKPNLQIGAGGVEWDDGYTDLGGGWRRLAWFGDYAVMALEGWIWHYKHGFFYVADTSTPGDVWLYANDMGWLYTGNTLYPFFYRASDSAWIWYNGATNPRWFMNFTSGQWESRP